MPEDILVPDVSVILRALRRRFALISLVTLTMLALTWLITMKLPRLYRAEGMMQVESVAAEAAALGNLLPTSMTQQQRGEQRQRVAAAGAMMTTPPVIDSLLIKLKLKGPKGGPRDYLRSNGPYLPLIPFPDMSVKVRAIQGTGLIHVHGFARTPEQAQQLAIGLMDCYLAEKANVQQRRLRTTLKFLDGQTAEMSQTLTQRRGALQSYQEEHGTVDPERETIAAIQRLTQLRDTEQQCVLNLRTAETTLRPIYEQLRSVLSAPLLDQLASPTAIADLETRLEQLEASRNDPQQSEASRRQTLRDIETVRGQLRDALLPSNRLPEHVAQSASRNLLSQYLDARVQLISLTAERLAITGLIAQQERELQVIPRQVSSILPLELTSDAAAETYRLALQQRGQLVIGTAVQASEVRPLIVPKLPTSPKLPWRTANLAIGLSLGLALGVFLALLIEYHDDRIRNVQVLLQAAPIQLLAEVPRRRRREDESTIQTDPQSPVARAYRSMRNRLWHLRKGGRCRTVAVMSARPGDGRTSASIGLARSIANESDRVLLVDADLLRPGLHKRFNVALEPGLTDHLIRGVKLEEVLRPTDVPGLSILAAGAFTGDPGAIFRSPGFGNLVTTLREQFDYIIFDTPAILVRDDVLALKEWVDDTLIVARVGKSRLRHVDAMFAVFRAAHMEPGHAILVGTPRA